MTTAWVTLTTRLSLTPGERAGICFRPAASSYFETMEQDLRELLAISAKETKSVVSTHEDSYGFHWVLLEDKDFEDLVATIYLVSQTVEEHGFGEQLLAAAFRFSQDKPSFLEALERSEGGHPPLPSRASGNGPESAQDGQPVYWIYNYKRGAFYPFVPTEGQQRDNALELRLRSVMERELPLERSLEQWYALWDIPF